METVIPEGNLRHIETDEEFDALMVKSGDSRLVVIDFYTTWCRPCKEMNPVIARLAEGFPSTLFVKVNAEKCMDTSTKHQISGVPAFIFYKNNLVIDSVQGKDPEQLERKIRIHDVPNPVPVSQNPDASPVTACTSGTLTKNYGISNVASYLDKRNCRCFNDLGVSSFQAFLDGRRLSSGRGIGKLLMVYVFNQPMMLSSFKIKAPKHSAPKHLKFFVNQALTVDFDTLIPLKPTQENLLTENDLQGESKLIFEEVRGQPVTTLHILVTENMTGHRKIEFDDLKFYGMPMTVIDFPQQRTQPQKVSQKS